MTTKTEITLPHEFRSANDIPVERATIKRERMIEIIAEAVEADRQNHIADVRKMVPSDEELIKWGGEEEFFLFCSQDEFLDIVKSALSRYGGGQPAIFGQAETRMNAGSAARNGGDLGQAAASVEPSGYAYRYPDGIRFNDGREVNGCKPTETLPYWFGAAPVAQELVAWMTPGNGRAITELELSRIPTDRGRQDRCREIYPVPLYAAPVTAQAQPVVNRQMTTAASDVLADTQRAIIEAAERRGYERAIAECAQDREDAERLDWLDGVAHCADWLDGEPTKRVIRASDGAEFTGDTWREAIDAARAAKERT